MYNLFMPNCVQVTAKRYRSFRVWSGYRFKKKYRKMLNTHFFSLESMPRMLNVLTYVWIVTVLNRTSFFPLLLYCQCFLSVVFFCFVFYFLFVVHECCSNRTFWGEGMGGWSQTGVSVKLNDGDLSMSVVCLALPIGKMPLLLFCVIGLM